MERISEASDQKIKLDGHAYLLLAQKIALTALVTEAHGLVRKQQRRVLTELEKRGMLNPVTRKLVLDSFGTLQRDVLSLLD